ncbi:hypothetical protein GN958_ATG07671 [Phytophthora infestans]|uniref:Uncharacterized protein n=1 Tax=Phytophthora infestans TaxID=4787 RepID=A0A8S9UQS0_PHYIN|nr:hypothetical protein GN958_ATG07671 [Phytophthora infestans]
MLAERCGKLGTAILLQRTWRWRVSHFDPLTKMSEQFQIAAFKSALRQGYNTVFAHTAARLHPKFGPLAIHLMRRVLMSEPMVDYHLFTDSGATKYLLFFDGDPGATRDRPEEAVQSLSVQQMQPSKPRYAGSVQCRTPTRGLPTTWENTSVYFVVSRPVISTTLNRFMSSEIAR